MYTVIIVYIIMIILNECVYNPRESSVTLPVYGIYSHYSKNFPVRRTINCQKIQIGMLFCKSECTGVKLVTVFGKVHTFFVNLHTIFVIMYAHFVNVRSTHVCNSVRTFYESTNTLCNRLVHTVFITVKKNWFKYMYFW